MVTQIAVINFIPGGVPPHVKVSQGDTAERVLQFQCYFGDASYSIPSGSTVVVNGAKPGGTVFTRSATFSGNVVTLPCAESMTEIAGDVPCEIMVTTSSGTISSANFILEVEGAPANDAAVSASDLSAMTELAATASQAAVDAAASAAQADADVVNTVKYSDIVNTGTTTQAGMKALDAVQNNPNIGGTLAARTRNLETSIRTVKTLGGITAIPANADLNTYTTPGEYYVETNTIAATIRNIPLAVAGRLTVEYGVSYVDSTIYIRHTYTPHSSAIFNQFTMVRASANTGNTWSAWQMVGAQLYSSQNTETVSVPSETWTEIYRASNVPAGIYEITFSGLFGTASAGMRSIQFANAAVGGTPSWSTGFGRRTQTQLPVTNGNTILTLTRVLRTTEVQDIVFAIYHTAGANISCNAGVDILRLA